MTRYRSIKKFRNDLIKEMGSFDRITVQDAVLDSEEHLNLMVEEIIGKRPGIRRSQAFVMAVNRFGYPSEIAEIYKRMDSSFT